MNKAARLADMYVDACLLFPVIQGQSLALKKTFLIIKKIQLKMILSRLEDEPAIKMQVKRPPFKHYFSNYYY